MVNNSRSSSLGSPAIAHIIGATLLTSTLAAGGCRANNSGCGDVDSTPIDTPVDVTDWNLTMERYDGLRSAAQENGGIAWDDRGIESQCSLACAYASDNLYAAADYGYSSLEIDSCELTLPMADADGILQCTATRTDIRVCIGGRRPLGWTDDPSPVTRLQHQLDGIATMEHVSITAFVELVEQLGRHRAPDELIARCQAAAADERRHVALLVELGAAPPTHRAQPAAPATSLREFATHNAIEGCVTETWAALLARDQAEHAADEHTRSVFAQIADDEARHAQLAWDLHRWLCERLGRADAADIDRARLDALARLEVAAMQQSLAVPVEVRRRLGLPSPRRAAALARNFGQRLAAAA